jgi:hypothetical protein
MVCDEVATILYQNLSITSIAGGFLPLLRLCCTVMSKYIFLISFLNRFRSIFQKNTIYFATLWQYFASEFF